jgi:hypothetical protein
MSRNLIESAAPIKQRILSYANDQGVSIRRFVNNLGITPGAFSGRNLNNELGGDKIARIVELYSNLSPDWLLLGKGNMLREASIEDAPPPVQVIPPPVHSDYALQRIEELARENERLQAKNEKLEQEKVRLLQELLAIRDKLPKKSKELA